MHADPIRHDVAATAPRANRIDVVVVLAVMAGYAVACGWITIIPDSARDLAAAYRIAHGDAWPLLGPAIGLRWQLGPAWFYVLAPIVAIAGTVAGVMYLAGLLAATKFWFAYRLGLVVHGRAFALLWVALLALPGWATFEHVVFSHTNLVQAMTIATLLAVWRLAQRATLMRAFATGLAWALAWHAHPTTIVLAPAIVAAGVVAWRGIEARARVTCIVALLAGLVLPLVPMLVAEARSGFAQFAATGAFVADTPIASRVMRLPAVMWGFAWHGIVVARDDLLLPLPGRGLIAFVVAALMAGGAIAALALPDRRWSRGARVIAAACVVAAIALIGVLRAGTSFYQVYAVVPLATGVAALGLAILLRRVASHRTGSFALALLVVLGLGSTTLVATARALAWRDGWQQMPALTNGDIAAPPTPATPAFDYFPARASDKLACALAARGGGAVRGDAGALLEYGQGIALAMRRCARGTTVLVGATRDGIAGYPAALLRAAGSDAARGIDGYAWVDVAASPDGATGLVVALRDAYPPHPYRWTADTLVTREIDARAGDWIAVTNLNRAFVAMDEPVLVRVDEPSATPIAVAARSANTWLWRATADGRHRVTVRAGDAAWIDALAFADAAVRATP